jgi:hypothetical protein
MTYTPAAPERLEIALTPDVKGETLALRRQGIAIANTHGKHSAGWAELFSAAPLLNWYLSELCQAVETLAERHGYKRPECLTHAQRVVKGLSARLARTAEQEPQPETDARRLQQAVKDLKHVPENDPEVKPDVCPECGSDLEPSGTVELDEPDHYIQGYHACPGCNTVWHAECQLIVKTYRDENGVEWSPTTRDEYQARNKPVNTRETTSEDM